MSPMKKSLSLVLAVFALSAAIGGCSKQEAAESVIEAVRDNLDVYVSLLGGLEIQSEALPEVAESYSIEDLLRIAARSRDARAAAREAEIEVVREQRVLSGASRRRDALFKDYLDASPGDDRWLAALSWYERDPHSQSPIAASRSCSKARSTQ